VRIRITAAFGTMVLVAGCGENGGRAVSPPATTYATAGALSRVIQPGQWTAPFTWPDIAVHMHLLPNGRVLTWGRFQGPFVWDPASGIPGTQLAVPAPAPGFCAGHAFLPDGRLLVNGGRANEDGEGIPNTNLFDFATQSWTASSPMKNGRWYPTTTTLPDGDLVTIAGTDINMITVRDPEIWHNGSWIALTGASLALPQYPRQFVAPNGNLFYAGEAQPSRWLTLTGTGAWTMGPARMTSARDYGSAVMWSPGHVLYVGGGDPPTNTAEVINLNASAPTWQWTGWMHVARRQTNLTLLADGTVMVIGGTSASGFNNEAGAVHAGEIWDPATGHWTIVPSNAVVRTYHSTAILLPDARVLVAGNGDASIASNQYSAEIYAPGYLFTATGALAARPTIIAVPTSVGYAQQFVVSTSNASSIAEVTFIRLGSVTHAFDQNQRMNYLAFAPVAGGLQVTTPASSNLAPPGYYLLFIVNTQGVPSLAKIVQIG
jgi:galactose oxidase